MNRPTTTLFLLMSVDGKISTGANDNRDFDKDLPTLEDVKDGLKQYYALEQETDLFSLNSGKVMAKVGWNDQKTDITKLPVSFVIVDNKPHLTSLGISNLIKHTKKLYIVTSNTNHPAIKIINKRLEVLVYDSEIDFTDVMQKLRKSGVDQLTIQSGGELNAVLLRAGLIDKLSIVVAPVLVGGRSTPTLIDGECLVSMQDLQQIKSLQLIEYKTLRNSYLHLRYQVLNG